MLAGEWQVAELQKILDCLRLVGRRFAVGHRANDPFAHGPLASTICPRQARDHVGLNIRVKNMRPAIELDVDQRFLRAHADATDADDPRSKFSARDFLFDGVQRLVRAGGDAASARADVNDRPARARAAKVC